MAKWNSARSRIDQTLIRAYNDAGVASYVCGNVGLCAAIIVMTMLGVQLAKDFDTATRADLQALVATLHRRKLVNRADPAPAGKPPDR